MAVDGHQLQVINPVKAGVITPAVTLNQVVLRNHRDLQNLQGHQRSNFSYNIDPMGLNIFERSKIIYIIIVGKLEKQK